ncbi:MAG: urea carboxylase-associated protein 2 [Verrucomicrobiales bacterium]|jgi:urea carboxylase-associated protein 2
MFSAVIGRGKTLRITAQEAGANVGLLLYNADQLTERYNMPDSLKGQQVFFLTTPLCMHSDMGRVLASVTADSCGWHDTVCGTSDASSVGEQYGEKNYQEARNEFQRSGRECFLTELAKWGLGKRDLVPNLNLFSKVVADEEGALSFVEGACREGAQIDLRFEMNCLVVLNTCPHPFDPATDWSPKPVQLEVRNSGLAGPDDQCRHSRPENVRAFENTENYYLLRD